MGSDVNPSETASNVTSKLSENIFIRTDREKQRQQKEAESQADTAESSKVVVLPVGQNTTIFKNKRGSPTSAIESENTATPEGQPTLASVEY